MDKFRKEFIGLRGAFFINSFNIMKRILIGLFITALVVFSAWTYFEKESYKKDYEISTKEWNLASEYDFKYINKLADFIKLQNTLHPVQFTKEEDMLFNEIKQLKDNRSKFIRQFSHIYPVYKARE
jgi:Tfp pilus assembly protein PilO